MPAPAQAMEVVTSHEGAVAVEVDPDLVPGAASRAAALVREGRERRDVYGLRLHKPSSIAGVETPVQAHGLRAHRYSFSFWMKMPLSTFPKKSR